MPVLNYMMAIEMALKEQVLGIFLPSSSSLKATL